MSRLLVYLNHIRDAFDRIRRYTRSGKDTFFKDTLVQDGVIRNLIVVGEATKNIPREFRETHEDVPWTRMAGMRDIVVHQYMVIDLDAVWDVVEEHIPRIYPQIERLIDDESDDS